MGAGHLLLLLLSLFIIECVNLIRAGRCEGNDVKTPQLFFFFFFFFSRLGNVNTKKRGGNDDFVWFSTVTSIYSLTFRGTFSPALRERLLLVDSHVHKNTFFVVLRNHYFRPVT